MIIINAHQYKFISRVVESNYIYMSLWWNILWVIWGKFLIKICQSVLHQICRRRYIFQKNKTLFESLTTHQNMLWHLILDINLYHTLKYNPIRYFVCEWLHKIAPESYCNSNCSCVCVCGVRSLFSLNWIIVVYIRKTFTFVSVYIVLR